MNLIYLNIKDPFVEVSYMIPLWKSPIKLPVELPVELPVDKPIKVHTTSKFRSGPCRRNRPGTYRKN